MTLPRLVGPRVALVPVPLPVARAVVSRTDPTGALHAVGLRGGDGWPHDDTADALRALGEHGEPGDEDGWLVVLDGEVVGDCGWRGGPDGDGDVLLGYGLAAPARGQGIGTEAVAVMCAWAEGQPGVRRLVADVLPGNEPSRRLLRRLAFAEEPGDPPHLRCVRVVGAPSTPAPPRIRGRHVC